MRKRRVLAMTPVALGLVVALGGCATVHNLPLNEPSADPLTVSAARATTLAARDQQLHGTSDGAVIALAFSGGGTRAAAFGYGVLQELQRTPHPRRKGNADLLDHVGLVSGVSGGSVITAYYGLKGRSAMDDFRQSFLTQDLMSQLDTRVSLINLNKALSGGVNTDVPLRDWFNAHLFDNATLGTVLARGRPIVLINATDVYSRVPFVFSPETFAAICSDIRQYPLAGAVAASAAVPAAFAPVVIETYPGKCDTPLPPWIERSSKDTSGSPLLRAYAKSLQLARTGKVKYIKLFDGGMVDNYGLSGLTIARASSGTPYGPLGPKEAVNLRRLLFVVVDAGQGPSGNWDQTVEGPSGKELVGALLSAMIDANSRSSYQAFQATMQNWRNDIVRWRCGLKGSEVARLRDRNGHWNCRDLKITVTRIGFDQLDPARAKRLDEVKTTWTLPANEVDDLISAGGDALKVNPAFRTFLKEM